MKFTALDVETANPESSSICQIGLAMFKDGEVVREECVLVNPEAKFDRNNVNIHGISVVDVLESPTFPMIYELLEEMMGGAIVVHHTAFDKIAITAACDKYHLPRLPCLWLDSAKVVKKTWPEYSKRGFGLKNLSERFGIQFQHHNALEDARTAGKILLIACEKSGIPVDSWLHKLG